MRGENHRGYVFSSAFCTEEEAYEEMKERHDFIMGQKADLEEARGTLLNTIAERDAIRGKTDELPPTQQRTRAGHGLPKRKG